MWMMHCLDMLRTVEERSVAAALFQIKDDEFEVVGDQILQIRLLPPNGSHNIGTGPQHRLLASDLVSAIGVPLLCSRC